MTEVNVRNFLEGKVTKQEVIDFVATKLIEQGRPSISGMNISGLDSDCLYRSPNGAKCAIGHLIPDEEYVGGNCSTGGMEGHSGRTLITSFYSSSLDGSYTTAPAFLSRLQNAHDAASENGDFKNTLIDYLKNIYSSEELDSSLLGKLIHD